MEWRCFLAPLQGMPKRGTQNIEDCAKMLLDFQVMKVSGQLWSFTKVMEEKVFHKPVWGLTTTELAFFLIHNKNSPISVYFRVWSGLTPLKSPHYARTLNLHSPTPAWNALLLHSLLCTTHCWDTSNYSNKSLHLFPLLIWVEKERQTWTELKWIKINLIVPVI